MAEHILSLAVHVPLRLVVEVVRLDVVSVTQLHFLERDHGVVQRHFALNHVPAPCQFGIQLLHHLVPDSRWHLPAILHSGHFASVLHRRANDGHSHFLKHRAEVAWEDAAEIVKMRWLVCRRSRAIENVLRGFRHVVDHPSYGGVGYLQKQVPRYVRLVQNHCVEVANLHQSALKIRVCAKVDIPRRWFVAAVAIESHGAGFAGEAEQFAVLRKCRVDDVRVLRGNENLIGFHRSSFQGVVCQVLSVRERVCVVVESAAIAQGACLPDWVLCNLAVLRFCFYLPFEYLLVF